MGVKGSKKGKKCKKGQKGLFALMSGHFYEVGFFNWDAKGNKKGKKGKRGKKSGFLALFALFALFVSSSPSPWRQILNMCTGISFLPLFTTLLALCIETSGG